MLIISIQPIYSQVDAYLPNPDQLDSLDNQKHLLEQPIDDTAYYIYRNLIHTNFAGFGDITKFSNDYQVFDFAFIGRPQYIAAPNLLPHQTKFILNNELLSPSTNGMFNTQFLSADQVKLISNAPQGFTSFQNTMNLAPLEISGDEPFTRVKFYEGDNRYTDLDIYFVRDIWNNARLKLAGFNKGYGGTGFNNGHVGVMYDTNLKIDLNEKLKSEIFWNRNHQRSGMGSRIFEQDHTYRADVSRSGIIFSYVPDSSSKDKMEAGFTSVVNRQRNARIEQNSDDYNFYISKEFSGSNNYLSAIISVDRYNIWGNAFSDKFSQTLLSLNLSDQFLINPVNYYEAGVELQSLSDYIPILNSFLSWNFKAQPGLFSRMKVNFSQRYPTAVESSIEQDSYFGNTKLTPETMTGVSVLQKWQVLDFLLLQGEMGFNLIQNEIRLSNNSFINTKDRNWLFLSSEGHLKFGQMILSSGGRIISAKEHISAKQSAWGKLIFHGDLFDGTIVVDASTNIRWYSRHDQIQYDPALSRFYMGSGKNPSYMVYGFKIVGTVQDAEIFFEIDNFLENEQKVIENYDSDSKVVRFGVNWVLWD